MALATGNPCVSLGTAGRSGGTKAQCFSNLAPSSIHRLSSATCPSVSRLPVAGGGILLSGSLARTRSISRLAPESPGRMASPGESKRRLPPGLRAPGPWHSKQFSDRIGRMCLLKLTGPRSAAAALGPCVARTVAATLPQAQRSSARLRLTPVGVHPVRAAPPRYASIAADTALLTVLRSKQDGRM